MPGFYASHVSVDVPEKCLGYAMHRAAQTAELSSARRNATSDMAQLTRIAVPYRLETAARFTALP
jgi:hypothetical protein